MAFDIESLNGVVFRKNQKAAVNLTENQDSFPIDVSYFKIADLNAPWGMVTKAVSQYKAGYEYHYSGPYGEVTGYVGPVFGYLQFDNSGDRKFYIVGFQDDKILLAVDDQFFIRHSSGSFDFANYIISNTELDGSASGSELSFSKNKDDYTPPARSDNPLAGALDALDGVTLEDAIIGKPGKLVLEQDLQIFSTYGLDDASIKSVGKINVISSGYRAGFTADDGAYILPSFGLIELEGVLRGGKPAQYFISGLGEDGTSLLLTSQTWLETGNNNSFYNDLSNVFGGARRFNSTYNVILSLDGYAPRWDPADPTASLMTFSNEDWRREAFVESVQGGICFAEGARLATARGLVAVEDLHEGDLVITASGAERPVKWIGRMRARPAAHPRPNEVNPVRVCAHAFGPNLPARDLRLSPGHAVFVDGVLVPVGLLVNGATIVQESVREVRYFHVELDSHDVLLAEGLPCESYLDDGNRARFANASGYVALHGRLDPRSWDDACAPLVAAGPQLMAIQEQLQTQAQALGWEKSEEADLHLMADGQTIAPLRRADNRYWFAVPAARSLELRSNSGVLAQLMPGIGDGRLLGVAVAELRVDGQAIDLAAEVFGPGFYGPERHEDHGWRWTNGAAQLVLPLDAPAMIEVQLAMTAPNWRRKVADLRVVA